MYMTALGYVIDLPKYKFIVKMLMVIILETQKQKLNTVMLNVVVFQSFVMQWFLMHGYPIALMTILIAP